MSASTPVTRPKNPATTLACPSPDLCTRATNTFHTLGVAPEGLPEMEVKLDLPDRDKASSDHKRKARLWRPPRKQESDSPRRKSSFCPLPPGTPVSPSGKAHLQNQVEGALGLPACNGKRKAHCLGEPHLQSSASHAKCWASPSRSKPKGHCGAYDLHLAPGSEPPVQLEKRKVSKAKVRGRKEEGIKTRKKTRSLSLSAGCTPTPAQILFHQNTSPDRLEVSQPREYEASKQAHPPSPFDQGPAIPPKMKENTSALCRDTKVETQGLDSAPGFLSPSHAIQDVRQFFTSRLADFMTLRIPAMSPVPCVEPV